MLSLASPHDVCPANSGSVDGGSTACVLGGASASADGVDAVLAGNFPLASRCSPFVNISSHAGGAGMAVSCFSSSSSSHEVPVVVSIGGSTLFQLSALRS